MNKRQKNVLLFFTFTSSVILILWYLISGKIFTVFQVLVEKKDDLFGWTEKQWVNKFVPGLDLAFCLIFILLVISLFLIRKYRNNNKKIISKADIKTN